MPKRKSTYYLRNSKDAFAEARKYDVRKMFGKSQGNKDFLSGNTKIDSIGNQSKIKL